MNNIPQDKLLGIADNTGKLINCINDGVKWVDSYLKNEDRDNTNYELKKYRRYLKNIRGVVPKKTVVALFGKSQVGKSYLVDSILSTTQEKKLQIPNYADNGKLHSFIGELNPPGGKESTGVVSRFSIEKNDHAYSLPIEIKLLSPKDIILILCDTYYSDIKYYERHIKKAEIAQFLEDLNLLFSGNLQEHLTEDDVYDIKDYLEKYFADKEVIFAFQDSKFWDIVSAAIIKIEPEKWFHVFELLWGKNDRFSRLFNKLIAELKTLDFSDKVFADFNALLIKDGSILDVQRIFELDADQNVPVRVETTLKQTKNVLRSKLAALTYEVTIPVKETLAQEKTFLNDVDILDFPGARARERYDEKDIPELEVKDFYNFYRRGKVSYLFNRYTENYEISSLLFCIDHEQLEVKELPILLNNWIKYYIGKDIKDRTATLLPFSSANSRLINPLFIIFTKANIMLQHKDIDKSGDYDYKWETRFKSIFVNEFCKGYDWHEKWVVRNNTEECFKNLYMLRSFDHPESIYEGFLANGKELKIVDDRVDYMKGLQRSFVNNPFNRQHFYDPETSWHAFTDLNKDGSEFIIENITPIANNAIRTNRYINLLNEFKENAIKIVNSHYHSDQADDQIRKAAREGADIQLKMDIVFGSDAYYFGKFIELLTISENEILEFYHVLLRSEKLIQKKETNTYILLRAQNTNLSADKSYAENLEVLQKNYKKESPEETEKHFKETEGIDLDELFYGDLYNLQNNSLILAEEARDYWFENKLNTDNFSFFVEQGFDKKMLTKLFDNIKATFNKLKLAHEIAKGIRDFVDVAKRIDDAEDMIAHITAGKINEFVNSMGWSYYSPAEKQKIAETNKANNLNLVLPDEQEIFQSLEKVSLEGVDKMSLEKLIDYMDKLNENLNKIPIDKETIKYVPMIKNYQRWSELMKISFIANCDIPTYNVEANRLLGVILDKMKEYHF